MATELKWTGRAKSEYMFRSNSAMPFCRGDVKGPQLNKDSSLLILSSKIKDRSVTNAQCGGGGGGQTAKFTN